MFNIHCLLPPVHDCLLHILHWLLRFACSTMCIGFMCRIVMHPSTLLVIQLANNHQPASQANQPATTRARQASSESVSQQASQSASKAFGETARGSQDVVSKSARQPFSWLNFGHQMRHPEYHKRATEVHQLHPP